MEFKLYKIHESEPFYEGTPLSGFLCGGDICELYRDICDKPIPDFDDDYIYVEIKFPGHKGYTSYVLEVDGVKGMYVRGCLDSENLMFFSPEGKHLFTSSKYNLITSPYLFKLSFAPEDPSEVLSAGEYIMADAGNLLKIRIESSHVEDGKACLVGYEV